MQLSNSQMCSGFLVFIAFPLYMCYVAFKKGRVGLAILTFLTIFVGLGPISAVYTLFALFRANKT